MLRTPAPLSRALYVGGLSVREGWLSNRAQSNCKAAVSCHLFARVLLAGRAFERDSSAKEVRSIAVVRHHAKLWKTNLSLVSGKGYYSASPVWWFTRAGSMGGTRYQCPTSKQLSYCVHSLSVSARR